MIVLEGLWSGSVFVCAGVTITEYFTVHTSQMMCAHLDILSMLTSQFLRLTFFVFPDVCCRLVRQSRSMIYDVVFPIQTCVVRSRAHRTTSVTSSWLTSLLSHRSSVWPHPQTTNHPLHSPYLHQNMKYYSANSLVFHVFLVSFFG